MKRFFTYKDEKSDRFWAIETKEDELFTEKTITRITIRFAPRAKIPKNFLIPMRNAKRNRGEAEVKKYSKTALGRSGNPSHFENEDFFKPYMKMIEAIAKKIRDR